MTKEKYLNELQQKLKKLPKEEIDAALEYYSEYFEDVGEEHVDETIDKLGTPSHVASQILSDYAVKDLHNHPESTKKGISAIWFILLAIFASPIAIPIALLIVCFIILCILGCFGFIVIFFSLNIALTIGGLMSIAGGVTLITQHIPTSLFFIGIGMTASGVGILLFSPLILVVKSASRGLAKSMKKLFDRLTSNKKERLS